MEKINLSCIINLYRNNLVYLNNNLDKQDEKMFKICDYKILFKYGKIEQIVNLVEYEVLVLVKNSFHKFMKNWNLLVSIINACKIDIGKIAILNYEAFKLTYNEINSFKNKAFIIFDVNKEELFFELTIYNYLEFQDSNKNIFVFSDSLDSLAEDKDKKRKLWLALKKIFNIK